ncbi:MAG: Smr/MutS family protein [Acidobacteriota bacterium]
MPTDEPTRREPAHGAPTSSDTAEDRQFREAMERLSSVPDKDASVGRGEGAASGRGRRRRATGAVRFEDRDRLDLHGHSVDRALERLESFVVSGHVSGRRRLLVITGRGLRSPDGIAVLRRAVIGWLRREGAAWVSSYEPAPQAAGGAGALVLRLRPKARRGA